VKVAVYPADLGGCGHYRLIWACRALAHEGFDVELHEPDAAGNAPWVAVLRGSHAGPHLVDLVLPPNADVVVLQRPLRRLMAEAVEVLQAKGVVVVVEIDDDFAAMSPANVAWLACQPKKSPTRNLRHLARACAAADWVTVSTPALARRYGAHGRCSVIPNYVPRRYLDVRRWRGEPSVVWSGELSTHPHDLQQVGAGVRQAFDATGASLRVVGSGEGVPRALGVAGGTACGWQPIDDYPVMLAQASVGIVPLELTAFNQAKSWLKGLELAAVGVPFVASPTQQYEALAADGIGVLAAKPKHWRASLVGLLNDVDRCEEMGEDQRRYVAARYVLEDHLDEWPAAWAAAARNRLAVA